MKEKPIENQLLNGEYTPMTGTIGFIECAAEHTAEVFLKRLYRTYTRDGRTLKIHPFKAADLGQALEGLFPLVTRPNRWLFLNTNSCWTAYFENWWCGTDPTRIAPLGNRCGCRSIRVDSVPHVPFKKVGEGQFFGSYGSVTLSVTKPEGRYGECERLISAMNDGGPWCFDVAGTPYPFEEVEKYNARRKRDRFTHSMLDSYLRQLGICAFEEDFYLLNGACSGFIVCVEGEPWEDQIEMPLSAIQAGFGPWST